METIIPPIDDESNEENESRGVSVDKHGCTVKVRYKGGHEAYISRGLYEEREYRPAIDELPVEE